MTIWDRNARCDELQFHVDHNTPLDRLRSWLGEVARGWYQNIGSTHFKDQTISTSSHEWFLVKDGVLRRIPDWLTAVSWGLLIDDRISIPYQLNTEFYNLVTIGPPLNFGDGPYADKIHAIWKEEDREYPELPSALEYEINRIGFWQYSEMRRSGNLFTNCTYQSYYSRDPYANLLDWTWMLRNPGCPLAE